MEFNATFLVSAVSFIVFVVIMNNILYKPIEQIVEQRQKFIDDSNNAAKQNIEKSEEIIAERDNRIAQTKLSAKELISNKTEEAQLVKNKIQSDAQQKSHEKIEKARLELFKSKSEAQNVLDQGIESLAQEISSKILG